MQESHRKRVAIHPDPESCVAGRKTAIEALTRAPAGRVLSCEIIAFGVSTPYHEAEGHIMRGARASLAWTLRSPRPRHVGKLHAREPGDPIVARACGGPAGVGTPNRKPPQPATPTPIPAL